MGNVFRPPGVKKIGLFLGMAPFGGGMFQYSQSMLEAIAGLPRTAFVVVAAYTDPLWRLHIAPYQIDLLHIGPGRWSIPLSMLWRGVGLPTRAWRRIAPFFHPVVRALVQEQCDLWIFPAQDAWSYLAPVPALATIHDLMHRYEHGFPEVSAPVRYHVRELHFRNICKWAKGVLVDSEVGKIQIHESYHLDSGKIFPLPYVPPRYIRASRPSADFDAKYNLPKKFVFYPAQFWQHKNHIRLINAVARLKEAYPDICLVLVGSKKNGYASAVEEVRRLDLEGRVRFVGYVPDHDMSEFYRRARALVMPTCFGPTNIPPLEAFALECPVAISRIYGTPEQVGDAALLFDPLSVDEIADCIRRLWSDEGLCRRLAAEGRARAAVWQQTHFNARLLKIVEQLTA